MTERRRPSEPGTRSDDDVTIGCLVGLVMGLVGVGVGTVALLLLRPTWIAREGDPLGTVVAGLVIGWAVAIAVAILATVILVLRPHRARGGSTMSTFIGQLVGFAVIVFLLWKYVVPPLRNMMKTRQQTVRTQLEDSAEATKKLAQAEAEHKKALEEAKAETAKVTEEARFDAEKIAEQLRAQADSEVERIKAQGGQQVQLLRQQLIRELRGGLGTESVSRASELVRAHVADPAAQSATVDRFLDELDAMAPSNAVIETGATARLRSASRESLAKVVDRFDEVTADLNADGLTKLADELASVAKLLTSETALNKHLAEPDRRRRPRSALLEALLTGKVGDHALELLRPPCRSAGRPRRTWSTASSTSRGWPC